ncbi:MAG: citrate synthase [Bdellovibrionales bacterium CG10_big_fil_rev_8_21_14_0_10_45_34]|nr:MAG: citrate synthase [Bdellovibrionales bacterium CG10_big_fil_rev_8_21_14_0_10_45_34]
MAEEYRGAIDKGLEGVVACTTRISSIVDATLTYRGYVIEDLAAQSTFEEVIFLLWHDRLASKSEIADLKTNLSKHITIEPELLESLKTLPTRNVHPMAWLRSAVSMMALWDVNAEVENEKANFEKAYRLTGKMASLVAAFERIRTGQPIVPPKPEKGIAWNFLYQLFGKEPDADVVRIFDVCLILHADHELNCSAFSARVTASSLSDIYSAVVSAIGALKGPLHGGANEQVMRMLNDIGTVENAREWVKDALENKKKIMGFGHRVYKNGDPRAKILRSMSDQLTAKVGKHHLYEMSTLIDDTVQKEKGLLPNVDFYSATVYYSMGITLDLFTPIFAASRVSGWLAHIFEQYSQNRIYRPRGDYQGNKHLKL